MRNLLRALGLLAFFAALPAQAQSLAGKLAAARVATQVEIALAQHEELRAFVFTPSFADGVLSLTGRVESDTQRERAGDIAGSIEGVESVINSVVVGGLIAADLRDLPAVPEEAPASEEEAEPEPEPEEVYHTVRRGDTLGAIARRYGVSVRRVQQLNGMRGTRIRVGQRLRVQ